MLLHNYNPAFDLDSSPTYFSFSPVKWSDDLSMDADFPVMIERWSSECYSSSFDDSMSSEDLVSSDYCSEMVQSAACDHNDLNSMMKAMLDDQVAYLDHKSTEQLPAGVALDCQQQKVEVHADLREYSHDKGIDFVSPRVGERYSDQEIDNFRLVHLLLGGAEAVVCGERDLAFAILDRLKSCSTRSGTTMQRIAAYFSDALHCKLQGFKLLGRATESLLDIVGAFQILHEICPYVKFGHFSANQAILESISGEQRVHIVDFDIADGVQWSSLMHSLASRKDGPPCLRITALYRPHTRGALCTTQETGKRLAACARQFNVPFTFNQVRADGDSEMFRASSFKFVQGEALVVNCMLHLPHMSFHSRDAVHFFLATMVTFQPRILTVVEEELSCTPTTFTGYVRDALYHYCTLFDSLEATLASETAMRSLVERVVFGPHIRNTVISAVSQAPVEMEAVGSVMFPSETVKQRWSSIAKDVGFQQCAFSSYNHCQAKLLVGLYNHGHHIQEDEDKMLLCWKSRPLIAASVWSSASDLVKSC